MTHCVIITQCVKAVKIARIAAGIFFAFSQRCATLETVI
jgi:hypothetical protein